MIKRSKNQMQFAVQHLTVDDVWVNTWTDSDENGETPVSFGSTEEALCALQEYLDGAHNDIKLGLRSAGDNYSLSDFRIVQLK